MHMLQTTPTPSSGTSDLLLPFSSLLAGILLSILVSFVARWIYDKYREPELDITKCTNIRDEDGFVIILIEVANEGKTAATNCTPTITISEVESETRRTSPYTNKKPLLTEPLDGTITGATFWLSSYDKSEKIINKDSSAWACICRMSDDGENSIEIPSEDGWNQPLSVLLKTRAPYNIDFQATAKECSSNTERFELRASENSLSLTQNP